MLLAQNARRAESGWQLSESSYQSVAGTVDAAVVGHRFDRFDHFFLLLSFLPLFFCSVLFGERLATTERERERERCSLQRDKSSRRAEGVPPGAPSKKRVTERERGRKFFFSESQSRVLFLSSQPMPHLFCRAAACVALRPHLLAI
jgi:hypothetical protein